MKFSILLGIYCVFFNFVSSADKTECELSENQISNQTEVRPYWPGFCNGFRQYIQLDVIAKASPFLKKILTQLGVGSFYQMGTTIYQRELKNNSKNFKYFMEACKKGDLNTVKSLVNSDSVNINLQTGSMNYTPLITALHDNYDISIIKFLVTEARADLDIKDENGWTALMHAITFYDNDEDRENILELLIRNGCNVFEKNNQKETAVTVAFSNQRNLNTFKTLVKNVKFTEISQDIKDICFEAIYFNRLDAVRYLHNVIDIDLSQIANERFTLLMSASFCGKLEIVQYLVNKWNSDINLKHYGRTAFEKALSHFDETVADANFAKVRSVMFYPEPFDQNIQFAIASFLFSKMDPKIQEKQTLRYLDTENLLNNFYEFAIQDNNHALAERIKKEKNTRNHWNSQLGIKS